MTPMKLRSSNIRKRADLLADIPAIKEEIRLAQEKQKKFAQREASNTRKARRQFAKIKKQQNKGIKKRKRQLKKAEKDLKKLQ